MKFLKSLFSSDNIVNKVSSGVDAAFFTKEEKAGHFLTLLKAYEPFRLAQRLLALVFCIPYALAWLITFGASFWVDITSQLELLQGDIAKAVGVILVFYFGGGALEGVLRTHKKSKG